MMMHSRIDGDMSSLRFSMCDVLLFSPFEKKQQQQQLTC